jgi:uncharacterized OB-fold protein
VGAQAATIESYTIIRIAPKNFADQVPYCVAIVSDGGAKETVRIAGYEDGQGIQIGDSVNRLPEPDEFGAEYSF